MTTLQAPDGTRYETDNDAEVRELTLGHGYRVIATDTQPDGTQPDTAKPPLAAEPAPPASEPPAPHPATPAN